MGQSSIAAADGALTAPVERAPTSGEGGRIKPVDGLRGLLCLMVVCSHYFGEVAHGLRVFSFGWIAVNMFFVMSGFLIGKLILEKRHHANFFSVFYARRFFRIVPPYVVTVLLVFAALNALPYAWTDAEQRFPLWSYLSFTQGGFMAATNSVGAHWLAPTWSLAVEEHFYLLAPLLLIFTPARILVPVLLLIALSAIILRAAVFGFGFANEMTALALLVGRADSLACGLLAAIAVARKDLDWKALPLRLAPIVALVLAFALRAASPVLFDVFGPLLISLGCTAFLLSIAHGAPEAKRFESKTLQFFGAYGYGLYLVHLPVLGLAHGLILGAEPDIATPAQWGVTLLAMPATLLVGVLLTKLVEQPLARYGRTWRWSTESRRRREPLMQPAAALS